MGQNQFALYLEKTRNYIYTEIPGGPKIVRMRVIINFFKCFTFLWVLGLMWYCNNFSTGMYFYMFLHGSYGWAWCIKQIFFPDSTFKAQQKIGSALLLALALFLYWTIPMTISFGYGIQQPTYGRIGICLILYTVGLVLMMGSDYQKTKTLAVRKGLISTGFFAITRNPNYLGQVMIYLSFALATGYWTSLLVLCCIQLPLFTINIYLKDQLSYSKKKGWDEYKQKSNIFLPKFSSNQLINYAIYLGVLSIIHLALKY